MMLYEIISTGSQGNAVVVNEMILIDCGVSFKALQRYHKKLKIVLLTHIHSDHFKASTIRKLYNLRPALRFACGEWMVKPLADAGVDTRNIDILPEGLWSNYRGFSICPQFLIHDVPNYGYKIHFSSGQRCFYATDAAHLNGIVAKGYDLYLVEANYDRQITEARIKEKRSAGEFAYEIRAMKNHLSVEQFNDFIYSNAKGTSVVVCLHCHVEDYDHENHDTD